MGDFASCRFDFRLDAKNGLMPSKRKKSERIQPSNFSTLFKCKQCGALFSSRTLLLDHKLTHTGHKCIVCSKTFAKRLHLREHMKTVHLVSDLTKEDQDDLTLFGNEMQRESRLEGVFEGGVEHGETECITEENFSEETPSQQDTMQGSPYARSPTWIPASADHVNPFSLQAHTNISTPTGGLSLPSLLSHVKAEPSHSTGAFSSDLPQTFQDYFDFIRKAMLSEQAEFAAQHSEQGVEGSRPSTIVVKQEPLQDPPCENQSSFQIGLDRKPSNPVLNDVEVLDFSFKNKTETQISERTSNDFDVLDLSFKNKNSSQKHLQVKNNYLKSDNRKNPSKLFDTTNAFRNKSPGAHEQRMTSTVRPNVGDRYEMTNSLSSSTAASPDADAKASKRTHVLTRMVEKLWQNKMQKKFKEEISSRAAETSSNVKSKYDRKRRAPPFNSLPSVQSRNSDRTVEMIPPANAERFGMVNDLNLVTKFEPLDELLPSFETETDAIDLSIQTEFRNNPRTGSNTDLMRFHPLPDVGSSNLNDSSNFRHRFNSSLSSPSLATLADSVSEDGDPEELESNNNNNDMEASNAFATNEQGLQCNFPGCDTICKDWFKLKVHSSLHTGYKMLNCGVCGYGCRHRGSMNLHMRSKHGLERNKVEGGRTSYVNTFGSVNNLNIDPLERFRLEDEEKYLASVSKIKNSMQEFRENLPRLEVDLTPIALETDNDEYCYNSQCNLTTSDQLRSPGSGVVQDEQTFSLPQHFPSACGKDDVNQNNNKSDEAQLLLTKVTPAPGKHPQFFTSLMRIKYPKKTPKSTRNHRQNPSRSDKDLEVTSASLEASAAEDTSMPDQSDQVWTDTTPATCFENGSSNFQCGLCKFNTANKGELDEHVMSTHPRKTTTKNKDYHCMVCGKGYSSKILLTHHAQKHHGQKDGTAGQFDCPFEDCPLTFHSRGAQRIHTSRFHNSNSRPKVHSEHELDSDSSSATNGERPLVCFYPGCDKAFRELKHLKVHQMQHTDEKPLRCELCEYSCRQRNSMNWHMKSKHGQEKHVTQDGRTIYL